MKRIRWQADWLWLAAVLLLFVLSFAWFPVRIPSDQGTFGTGAGGKRAFLTLADRLTPPATRSVHDFFEYPEDASTICVLGPARYPSGAEWLHLYDWVLDGNSLIFAARHDDPAVNIPFFGTRIEPRERPRQKKNGSTADPQGADASEPTDGEGPAKKPKTDAAAESPSEESKAPESATTQWDSARKELETSLASGKFDWRTNGYIVPPNDNAEVLASWDGKPQVVRERVGDGIVVFCSSDFVFSNQSLATRDNGTLAYRILELAEPQGVSFDETLNASGSPKVIGLLMDAPMRPITLQLFALAVLFAWLGYRSFGPVAGERDSEHRSFTEHAAALGNLHWKSGTGNRAVAWYLEYLRNELRLHYSSASGASEATILARRAGLDEQTVARLLADARDICQRERSPGSRAASIVRELARIKHRLDHSRRA